MIAYLIGLSFLLVGGILLYIKYLLIYKPKFKDYRDNKNRKWPVISGVFEFVVVDLWLWSFPLVTFLIGIALIILKTFGLIIDLLNKLKIIT
jgi:hypothetical protein